MNPALLERLWFGDDPLARAARAAALPAAALFRTAAATRNRLYDAGMLRQSNAAIPAISIGNLTVGGTGKTPLAAWLAGRLMESGAHPAIVLRGYGDDEPRVHELLNPAAIVVTDADRVRGVARAAVLGADVAVLDDAFQHRRIRRAADLVLVSADRPLRQRRSLPAGPWREPLAALERATVAIVTRKAAGDAAVDAAIEAVSRAAHDLPIAVARLSLGELRSVADDLFAPPGVAAAAKPVASRSLSDLRGLRVLAVAALGEPRAFVSQLESAGALVTPLLYPDHHAYGDADVSEITRQSASVDLVVCSLKDAVKLAPVWPRVAPNVWYVTQKVSFEHGERDIARVLELALSLRSASTPT